MALRSSIDLGTNTCLLLLAEWNDPRGVIQRVVSDHSTIVRLGQGVDQSKRLHPDAMKRTLDCLREYNERVCAAGGDPRQTVCVATSQARDAANSREFFDSIEKELGFRFRVISGEDEARLTFLGALLPGMSAASTAVLDIGGGSTEIVTALGGLSLDIGSVRFTERFLKSDPVTDAEFWACQDAIDTELKRYMAKHRLADGLELLATAGTATTLAAWQLGLEEFDAAQIDQCTLTRGDAHRLVEELKWRTIQERAELPSVDLRRADVLLAGAHILWRALEILGFARCRISTRGLRFGVLTDVTPTFH